MSMSSWSGVTGLSYLVHEIGSSNHRVVDNGRVDDAAYIDTRKTSLKRKIAETEDVMCTDRAISLPSISSSEQPSPPKRSCQGCCRRKKDGPYFTETYLSPCALCILNPTQ